MAAIGGVSFDFLAGPALVAPADATSREQRPGVDNERYLVLGRRGAAVRWSGLKDFASESSANDWIASVRALHSQIVTVTDEHGRDHDDVLVLGSDLELPRAIVDPQVGSSLRFRVRAQVDLVVTE